MIEVLASHGVFLSHTATQSETVKTIQSHVSQNLPCCQTAISLFQCTGNIRRTKKIEDNTISSNVFPPKPVDDKLIQTIAQGYCKEFDVVNILEAGCAVCGCLTSVQQM
ncbi:hypothetical protein DENSPDRAFT_789976, partial [Dentipellis sp. KUC8613]